MCPLHGVKHRPKAANNLKTNGKSERCNKTILVSLQDYVSEHEEDWYPFVQLLHVPTMHSSLALQTKPCSSMSIVDIHQDWYSSKAAALPQQTQNTNHHGKPTCKLRSLFPSTVHKSRRPCENIPTEIETEL